ncbi:hypothetical protein [Umezawaea tangerina]|uniref:Uncharacterized protein n=1 Tax=Umezawaea tangerina TaxID=84725 RepID=A0A2T0SVX1_9PSEU|nr:hypothetical protein [Umezawaea tangerina]PRY37513.1 hypothetical protein CLV43_110325 [Umezawaea tangerina]
MTCAGQTALRSTSTARKSDLSRAVVFTLLLAVAAGVGGRAADAVADLSGGGMTGMTFVEAGTTGTREVPLCC